LRSGRSTSVFERSVGNGARRDCEDSDDQVLLSTADLPEFSVDRIRGFWRLIEAPGQQQPRVRPLRTGSGWNTESEQYVGHSGGHAAFGANRVAHAADRQLRVSLIPDTEFVSGRAVVTVR